MEKLGTVTKTDGEFVEVTVHRDSACGENCAACGLCANRDMTVTVKNPGGLCVGDEVRLLAEDKKFLKVSALGYLSLTLLLFLGGIIGAIWGSEWLSFILAILFVFAGVLVLRKLAPDSIEIKIEKLR
ncbi:MAG: hypothetical protein E7401_04895 [Ruminococcaceae bacterium]|nr:hypothetical protein [Oscillospiraceae bacterium]